MRGGMAKQPERSATVGLRYMAMVKERGLAQQELNEFLDAGFSRDKINVKNFLREGVHASANVRKALISFASEKLGISLTEAWFDTEWHPAAPIDVFLNQNSAYESIIRKACGHYLHVSARALNPATETIPTTDMVENPWRVGRLEIEDHDNYFGFRMGSKDSEAVGDNPISGFVVCHLDTFFLTGFDTKLHEKAIFLVLRKSPQNLSDANVKFCGLQVGTLPVGNMPNGRAVAKRVALVTEAIWTQNWTGGKSMPDSVLNWLTEGGSALTAVLVTERLDETW